MLLREVFELGLPVAKGVKESKTSKYERVRPFCVCFNDYMYLQRDYRNLCQQIRR